MTANLPVAVGTEVTADLLNEISGISDSASFLLTTSASPLTTTANTKSTIVSGSYSFTSGYAYELTFEARYTINGTFTATQEGMVLFGLNRASAAGTQIFNSGYVSPPNNSAGSHFYGSQVVKVTAGDTTQTVCFTAEFSTLASATSLAITCNGSITPARLTIRRIGLSSNHTDAIELPTA